MTPVKLPPPPSTNDLWRVVRTRKGNASVTLKSQYRHWLDEAILLLRMGMPKVTAYPVAVHVVVIPGEGWNAARDLDNAIKPLCDALRKSGRIVDDCGKYVAECHIKFGPPARVACVLVSVEPAGAVA